jgi:hypothetical protein
MQSLSQHPQLFEANAAGFGQIDVFSTVKLVGIGKWAT